MEQPSFVNFFFLILGMIFFGLATIAGLILGVVGLSTDKPKLRNGGFITLGIGLVLLIATIAYTVNRTVEKVKDTVAEVGSAFDSTLKSVSGEDYQDIFEDNRDYLLNDSAPNAQIQKIKSWIPDDVESGIKPNYFTYFGFRDGFRYPMVYPYSIHCVDTKDFGTLVDESNVTDVKNGGGDEINIQFGVTHFNYDDKMILLQTTNKLSPGDDKEKISYFIYDYATKKLTEFNSEAEMLKKAVKLKYSGDKKLMTITEYDYLF